MKYIEITAPSRDAFQYGERPDPVPPTKGRILVRMKAGSINFADLAVASGQYPGAPYPIIPLADGAGEVVAIGEDVWQVKVGDRVAVHVKARWIAGRSSAELANPMRGATLPGSLVEIAELDAAGVVKIPDYLSWEAAGTLPVAAMTAWRALEAAHIGPASTVALLGTGGVSIFALQLAKARGARVIITSSSEEKLRRARELGADEVFNYRKDAAWDVFIQQRTGGVGADLVIDPVGGEAFNRSVSAVRHGGTVAAIGFLGGGSTPLDLLSVIFKEVRVQGANGGSVADLAAAVAAIAAHRIEPVIDRKFTLNELAQAYELMSQGGHFGKIAIEFDW
ncbi:alcohol dehydrogenase [Enterobacter sp. 10-1]|uniref:zinc-dependent alcohol dehydrogenase family protein n=1 Tax=Raoultella sp. 10-1 TaxID=2683201 RepID=UPI000BA45103|nr:MULTISPECIES: NAD(P)-dependent alcohol dehydrogenase [Enterobacteriaceae]MVT01946.1 zinc-binding dehydrogenase [Raoultella sp. 10-1]PAC14466.1 alcohol dehydrogenase [Enterobacter sp. 10-1]